MDRPQDLRGPPNVLKAQLENSACALLMPAAAAACSWLS
jgi:hypothetical protein